ncbi:amino acid permease [Mangrovactinospora gilvigrisea]|uniref:Amino acid permease n=1 Tax=Mangrovactinospora gilvigrisea TaxID=1428644 RepID=A0A1J7B9M8_9ACTN|nr:amino acid permease [Mangrovactinospora gilvigrisea]OIV35301.1 amino acid permease [Mangrovactinospora gilvigrisea]
MPATGTGRRTAAPRTVLRVKSPQALLTEAGHDDEGHGLKRTMGLWQTVAFGIGAVVGTGIFVVLGDVVPKAGPAAVVSFALAGLTCVFSALAFAELAAAIPVSGSSYSYAYASLGEGVAWLVGWCLLLEYGVSVSAVAVGWGQYLNELLHSVFGWQLPAALSNPPGSGGVVDLPALVVVLLAALLLIRGVRESARAAVVMMVVKLGVLALFVAIALTAYHADHFADFAPHGMAGIGAGASLAFFSFIGFDAISTTGEEVKNPRRNLPLAIVLCMAAVTLIYCVVAWAAVGAMPASEIGKHRAVLAVIVDQVTGSSAGGIIVAVGAVVAIASVVLTVLYGQTRILMAMSRDGLVPKVFERVSPRTATPVANTWIVGGVFGLLAAVVPLDVVVNLTTIGTLAILVVVNISVIVLRRRRPDLPRFFRVPLYPVTPILGIAFVLYLMWGLGASTWIQFGVYLVLGVALYFAYGHRKSKLRNAGS